LVIPVFFWLLHPFVAYLYICDTVLRVTNFVAKSMLYCDNHNAVVKDAAVVMFG